MNILEKYLQKQNLLIIDGALGTQIQKNGYAVNDSLWSAKYLHENCDVIKEVHLQYLVAGADIIISSSYQASLEGFLQKGFSKKRAIELLKSSINIAKDTVDEFWENLQDKSTRLKPLVAASIGPYGAFLANGSEYTGKYDINDIELKKFHKNRLELILSCKPDIIAIETIPSLYESKIIVDCLDELENTIPTWLCFSAKDEHFTNAGDKIEDCAKYFHTKVQINAIGINCTKPQYINSLILNINEFTNKSIVVYPNGGSKYNPITKVWEKGEISSDEYAKMSHLWYKNGACLIGGCCETTPEDIKKLRQYTLSIT